jgi:AcrR family transcriptional regulator
MPKVARRDKPKLVEERRAQILKAALEVMAQKSFEAASVDEIARVAGVSKGTVYLYFESKQAIVDEFVRRYSLLPSVELLKTVLASAPLADALRTLLPVLWLRLKDNRDVVALLLREGAAKPESGRSFVENVVIPANGILAEWLERHVGPERARQIDTFVAARALIGMLVVFFFTQELLGGSALRPIADEAITNTIAEVFLHGVLGRTEPGS